MVCMTRRIGVVGATYDENGQDIGFHTRIINHSIIQAPALLCSAVLCCAVHKAKQSKARQRKEIDAGVKDEGRSLLLLPIDRSFHAFAPYSVSSSHASLHCTPLISSKGSRCSVACNIRYGSASAPARPSTKHTNTRDMHACSAMPIRFYYFLFFADLERYFYNSKISFTGT